MGVGRSRFRRQSGIGVLGMRRGGWENRLGISGATGWVGSASGSAVIGGAGAPTWGFRALKALVWAWGAALGVGAGARRALAAAPIE